MSARRARGDAQGRVSRAGFLALWDAMACERPQAAAEALAQVCGRPAPARGGQAPRPRAGRDAAAYARDPTATLGTWRNFWASRLDYFRSLGAPTVLADFVVGLLDRAGAADPATAGADVTRVQEVLRYKD